MAERAETPSEPVRRRQVTGRVACAAIALTSLLAACSLQQSGPAIDGLTGTTWRLVEFRSSDDRIGVVRPNNPANYTMSLEPEGRVNMRLDCNSASGTWTSDATGAESGSFRFGPLAMTRVFCQQPSMDVQIARDSGYVRSFLLRDGRLYLDLMADAGQYVWEPTGR